MAIDAVQCQLNGRAPRQVIFFVPGRLINIVGKEKF
jgi:hypothetical protein